MERRLSNESRNISLTNPAILIPPELLQSNLKVGEVKILSHIITPQGGFAFVIVDEDVQKTSHIGNTFTYFDSSDVDSFPGLRISRNRNWRILLYSSLSHLTDEILFCGMVETHPDVRGKGVGVAYQQSLEKWARSAGYRFLTGFQNTPEAARFFLNRGRFLLDEVKDEYKDMFALVWEEEKDAEERVFFTIKFLNPEDAHVYIKPDRLNCTVDDRIAFRQKKMDIVEILGDIQSKLQTFKSDLTKPMLTGTLYSRSQNQQIANLASLIEITDDLNLVLPEEIRFASNLGDLKTSEIITQMDSVRIQLQGQIDYLRTLKDELFKNLNDEQIKEAKAKINS